MEVAMKFADIVDEVKSDIRQERLSAAKSLMRMRLLEIEQARHTLNILERQLQELCMDEIEATVVPTVLHTPVVVSAPCCVRHV
jgi:hypothetical protein